MTKFGLFKDSGMREKYWTGEMNPTGSPKESVHVERAWLLETAELAYLAATEESLFTWKVFNIDDRLEDRPEWKKEKKLRSRTGGI